MAENTAVRKIRHRGRLEQVGIYFTKLLRLFVYQNDWKLLPMSNSLDEKHRCVYSATVFF